MIRTGHEALAAITAHTAAAALLSSFGNTMCRSWAAGLHLCFKPSRPTANLLNRSSFTYMATYLELKAQAEALAQQAEEARTAELESIIATIREQITEYGITPDQLFRRRRAPASGTRAPVAPKYRDPKTGATWSGRGKAPHWIANAKNRDRFLIEQ